MFGPMGGYRVLRERERAMALPSRDVTWAEFLAAARAAGMDEPEFQGRLSATMGAHTVVGNEKLRIVGDVPPKEA